MLSSHKYCFPKHRGTRNGESVQYATSPFTRRILKGAQFVTLLYVPLVMKPILLSIQCHGTRESSVQSWQYHRHEIDDEGEGAMPHFSIATW